MQVTCDRNELTGAIERVAHAISDGLTGNGNQTAEEITNQTEELTELDSPGTMNTKSKTAADILNEAAIEARRKYFREYRARNRDRLNARQRQWHKEHPEKAREYLHRYWMREALKMLEEQQRQQSGKLFITVSGDEVVENQSDGEV